MADAQRTPEPGVFTPSCFNYPRHEAFHYFLLQARSLGGQLHSQGNPADLQNPDLPSFRLHSSPLVLPQPRSLQREEGGTQPCTQPRSRRTQGTRREALWNRVTTGPPHRSPPSQGLTPPSRPAPGPRSPQPPRNRAPLTSEPPHPQTAPSPQAQHAPRSPGPSPAPFPRRPTLAVPAARRGRHVGRCAPLCAQRGGSHEPPPPPANGLRARAARPPHRRPVVGTVPARLLLGKP